METHRTDKIRLTIRISGDLRQKLESYVNEHCISCNEAVALAIEDLVNNPDLARKKDIEKLNVKLSKIEKSLQSQSKKQKIS